MNQSDFPIESDDDNANPVLDVVDEILGIDQNDFDDYPSDHELFFSYGM